MAIKIGSNFTFQGEQPNFERDRFATKAAMKAFPKTSIDDGHLSYCAEDGNTYQFKSSNSVDTITGKWRVFKADVDLSTYATIDSVDAKLSNKVNLEGEGIRTPSRNTIVKIAIFNFGYIRYKTSYAYLTIMCRNVITKVVIAINNDALPGKLTVFEKRVVAEAASYHTQETVYYYHETDTGRVTLYYSASGNDEIRVKLTDKGVNYDFGYNTPMEIVDALPEGAIEVHDINYGNKNLFYATPKNNAGDPTFRAIDITDIPDLSKKYQTINANGYQRNPLMINASIGAESDSGYKYLTALTYGLPDNIPYKASSDWYFATDGTLQDITTKIHNITLDDAVSTTSTNGVENQAITKYVDNKVTTINSRITDLHTSLESTQTDFVDLRNKVNAMPKTVFITQAAYDALTTKDANTIYYING